MTIKFNDIKFRPICRFLLLLLFLLPVSRESGIHAAVTNDASRETVSCIDATAKTSAVLSDLSQIYNICSSCPVRLIPSSYAKLRHAPDRYLHFFNLQNTLYRCFNGSRCNQTSPFLPMPSCEYVIFMLGHLLC